jgi:hypothetical protein
MRRVDTSPMGIAIGSNADTSLENGDEKTRFIACLGSDRRDKRWYSPDFYLAFN